MVGHVDRMGGGKTLDWWQAVVVVVAVAAAVAVADADADADGLVADEFGKVSHMLLPCCWDMALAERLMTNAVSITTVSGPSQEERITKILYATSAH